MLQTLSESIWKSYLPHFRIGRKRSLFNFCLKLSFLHLLFFHTTRIILLTLYRETDEVIYVLTQMMYEYIFLYCSFFTVQCILLRIHCFWLDDNYCLEGIFPSKWLFLSDQNQWVVTNIPNIGCHFISMKQRENVSASQVVWHCSKYSSGLFVVPKRVRKRTCV